MRLFSILILSVLFADILIASPASKEEAMLKAQQFYSSTSKSALRSAVDLHLVYTDATNSSDVQAGFYVFDAGENDGFVMVSGDDRAVPILAYTDHGRFPSENIPLNLKNWLDFYHKEMLAVTGGKPVASLPKSATHSTVQPLLGGTKWGQVSPYNLLCPLSENGSERTVVGCVATAMAQVMKYHQWPPKSTGLFEDYEYNYDFETGDELIDTIHYNFGETTFRWEDMLDSYLSPSTPTQDSAVAQLSMYCGRSVQMMYGLASEGGSFASPYAMAHALVKNFDYDPDLRLILRDYYDQASWSDLLMNELDAGRPILYGGASNSNGHEFVCDGYDSNGLFHFNWGWEGQGDGYYVLSVANPGQRESGGYVYGQDAVIGIRKNDGVVNLAPIYEMCMFETGLTSTVRVLNSASDEFFAADFGYLNGGANRFKGSIGVALYKGDEFLKCFTKKDSILLNDEGMCYSDRIDSLSLAGCSEGNYRLYAVYKPEWSATWSKFMSKTSLSNYVDVNILGNTATFSSPDLGPAFVQSSQIEAKGDVYQFRPSCFSVSIKNNGQEFNSYMALCIRSKADTTRKQYLNRIFAFIGKGETKNFEFTGKLTLDTGSYDAFVVYDSLCSYSTWNYKRINSDVHTPFQFNVRYYAAPDLTLNRRLQVVGGDSIYENEEFSLNVEFANLGATYDNEVAMQLYPAEPGFQLGQTGVTSVLVDSCSTKSYILKGSFKVGPGMYRLGVFCTKKDGRWDKAIPANMEQTDYSWFIPIKVLAQSTGLDATKTKGMYVGRNPVGASVELITEEAVFQSEIYDVNGRIQGRFTNLKTLPAGDLAKGVYMVRVTTDKGVHTVRFVK